MPNRLINLFVKNVSAVGSPANRRRFLVIKAQKKEDMKKDEQKPITFDDAIVGSRLYKVYTALSEQYGAVMETLDSIRASTAGDKAAQVKTALSDFLKSMQSSLPGIVEAFEMEYDEDVEKSGRRISTSRMAKLKNLRKVLDEIIKEGEVSMSKETEGTTAPDAGALRRLASGVALLFGRTMGASDEDVAALEKAASGEDGVEELKVDPKITAQLAKSEKDQEELRKSNEELAKEVKELREAESLRKFADEVSGYKDIGLDPEKDAQLLKSVSENLSEEQASRIREIFKSAVAQKSASKLFEEAGSRGGGALSAQGVEAEIQTRIDGIMSKNAEGMTMEKAREQVFREDPSLYNRWRRETAVRV